MSLLAVQSLTCGYGDMLAVEALSFAVERGEIFALIGANGAGKTSTLMCLAGHVQQTAGQVMLDGVRLDQIPARLRVKHGVAIVPEGRRVFADLSVEENLMTGGFLLAKTELAHNLDKVCGIFPRLADRLNQAAGSLSGGEQQMLAIARALMAKPRLLLVDELSLGLMPKIIDECYAILKELQGEGLSILLVEQNTERVLATADRICVLESGRTAWSGTAHEARDNTTLIESYLGAR